MKSFRLINVYETGDRFVSESDNRIFGCTMKVLQGHDKNKFNTVIHNIYGVRLHEADSGDKSSPSSIDI